jgi:hypothetical protein
LEGLWRLLKGNLREVSTVEGRELGLVPVIEGRGGTWSDAVV